jgi:hypothetical protein
VDAIADVHAKVGIERGQVAHRAAAGATKRDGRVLLAVEDGPVSWCHAPPWTPTRSSNGHRLTRSCVWARIVAAGYHLAGATRCSRARLAVSAPLRVIDLSRARACAGPPRLKRTAVLLLRAPLRTWSRRWPSIAGSSRGSGAGRAG